MNAPSHLRTAVVMVLNDDGFSIPSEPSRKSRILAKKYLEWCQLERNERNFVSFSMELRHRYYIPLPGLETFYPGNPRCMVGINSVASLHRLLMRCRCCL